MIICERNGDQVMYSECSNAEFESDDQMWRVMPNPDVSKFTSLENFDPPINEWMIVSPGKKNMKNFTFGSLQKRILKRTHMHGPREQQHGQR